MNAHLSPPSAAIRSVPLLNLIAWDNGVGLSRDLRLLERALRQAGFDVHINKIGRGKLRKWTRPWRMRVRLLLRRLRGERGFDANVMLEHLRPEDFPFSARNLFIPNSEWCLDSDVTLLPQAHAVLTKTEHAVSIFAALGCRVASIGFTSEDRYAPAVPRERSFFHLAGRSRNKGTRQLLVLWQRHPEWPRLTVVQSPRTAQALAGGATNIDHRIDYMDDAELRRLQNASWFHLCPSETEGFGHYIVEAMSVGAVILSIDAPPMNELVGPDRGVLVPYARTGSQHLATTYYFDERAMEAAIERVLALPEAELQRLGGNARAWFLRNDREFPARLKAALEPLFADAGPATGNAHG